jgi:uncharacterized protein YacL
MWACLMYSGGLPILYPIAFIFYLIFYWVYKILLLKFYQRTTKNDENLAIKSNIFTIYGVMIHLIVCGLMFTNKNILSSSSDDSQTKH